MDAWSLVRKAWRRLRGGGSRWPAEALRRAATHPFDTATGLDTAGLIEGRELAAGHRNDRYNISYYGTAPSLFHAVMERWGGDPSQYTFVDVGCGKGRVLLLASEMPFQVCVGVELSPALAEVAEQNFVRWKRAVSTMCIVRADATDFIFPDGPCVFYLFNPFTGEVLEQLLARIAVEFAGRPGELDLLYVNAEFSSVLRATPGFELLWEMPVQMSAEDAAVDLLYLTDPSGRGAYAEAVCSGWRWVGR